MKILAIDPGNTTGWVLYDLTTMEPIRDGEIKGNLKEVCKFFLDLDADLYIIEDFRVYYNMGPALAKLGRLWSVEIGAVLRYILPEHKIVFQHPASRPMLQFPSKSEHVRDAYRHLYYWLQKTGHIPDYKVRIMEVLKDV